MVEIQKFNGRPIGLQLPLHVKLAVTYTEPGGEKFKEPDLVVESASYLCSDSSGFNFMNQETFEP